MGSKKKLKPLYGYFTFWLAIWFLSLAAINTILGGAIIPWFYTGIAWGMVCFYEFFTDRIIESYKETIEGYKEIVETYKKTIELYRNSRR